MQSVTLAYRDVDRLPVICAIHAMARRHYDVDVRVVRCDEAGVAERAEILGGVEAETRDDAELPAPPTLVLASE